jgi:hypothetical protein
MLGCETCSYTFFSTPNLGFLKQNMSEFLEAVNFLTKKIHVGVHVSTFLSGSNSIDLHAFEKEYVSIQTC